MSREYAFKAFKDHPWLSRVYKQLNKSEFDMAIAFIEANDHLAKDAFEQAAVRMFLDKPKPKHWTAIEELLVCANSSLK